MEFIDKSRICGQDGMLVEKALYNRDVVMSDGKGGVVEVSAKQLLADKA